MHLIMLLTILILACGLRSTWKETPIAHWRDRWHRTLQLCLLPPLLLFTSSISVIWMGPHGQMVWNEEGWFSYFLAIGFIVFTLIYLLKLAIASQKILHEIHTHPITTLHDHQVCILDLPTPYSAQIGFWQSKLVITQGLLDLLDSEHLAAVLAHEQAHDRYRDTFWFFWLGWLRRITSWLPQTEAIWQELLVLRELRADRWASKQTDPLLVAEALLLVVQNTPIFDEPFCVPFSQIAPVDRLNQRIDALLMMTEVDSIDSSINWWFWLCLLLALLPLSIIPFHC